MVKMTNYCILICKYSEKNLKYKDKQVLKFGLVFLFKIIYLISNIYIIIT